MVAAFLYGGAFEIIGQPKNFYRLEEISHLLGIPNGFASRTVLTGKNILYETAFRSFMRERSYCSSLTFKTWLQAHGLDMYDRTFGEL